MVETQSVKNTDMAERKGEDAGKNGSGIKRHLAVDSLEPPLALIAQRFMPHKIQKQLSSRQRQTEGHALDNKNARTPSSASSAPSSIGGYHMQTPPARNHQRLLDPPDQRIVNWPEGQRADFDACFAKRLCRNDAQRICAFAMRGKEMILLRQDGTLQTGLQESQNGWKVE